MSGSTGRTSLRLAMSLDGYIADENGGYDWIGPVPSPTLDTAHQIPFDEFLEDVDLVQSARDQGRHCFLFGGGRLVESFLRADAVDRLTVGVVPVLLGSGRPLFGGRRPRLDLRLVDCTVQDGKVRLVYERR